MQLLTAFLMILPFQPSFDSLDTGMRGVYLVTAGAAVGGTIFLVAPVSWHRLLFRRHRLQTIVTAAHRCTLAGLALLGVAMCGVTMLIVDVVVGPVAAVVTGTATAAVFVAVWLVEPMRRRRGSARVAAPRRLRR
ncbi:sodium:proton antiporter [Nocardia cyriacigeorgica]|uniref:Sodium:proton antiporter n=1 Tax=Nocardia cyriacigeorgica TaxID=135487 RepID=A0A6P1D9C1_9NOCA|nr:sodium:proton antiporter [Nocardia cyriacigeorgica]NEW45814.1 sodium:proton antiporter [Nocardia cyriacigeorgica]NEW48461.1 sodium:proton antiporter [Nocardia cyriacigeorgica]NEW57551.1 sodium:proton antiporter [Nocardia cyriacigeorgica]